MKNLLMALSLLGLLSACSPGYVVRAAYEQSKILLAREQISDVIHDPRTSAEERDKLRMVLAARLYAIDIGMNPKRAFTQFTRMDKDAVAWVVSAAPKDAFSLYQWWFPIVGNIPYKGFFDKQEAIDAARTLETEGYETWVRGTEAFSTLGWFNDPLLSTTLRNDTAHIVNTVLHESLHTTLWVPNHVDFNESLANFVGSIGAIKFIQELQKRCANGLDDANCQQSFDQLLAQAHYNRDREFAIGKAITDLYAALETLYKSDKTRDQKLSERELIFNSIVAPLHNQYSDIRILKKINNAEILQLHLYMRGLEKFDRVFKACNENWTVFLSEMRNIADEVAKAAPTQEKDPYKLLELL